MLVVAYNAESTLVSVLERIPAEFRPRIAAVLVSDDHSQDDTFGVGLGYRDRVRDLPLTVLRQERNLGYGGNQKVGYRWAIEQGLDVIVLLHGDGQYAPELLPEMVDPLVRGEADAVFGSRMLEPGAARRGGMPHYKFFGNKVLSAVQNRLLGTTFSEWHSGYRAYRVDALAGVPFERNDDGFNFDTQLAIQLIQSGRRIIEVPIPTYYGDEICYVNGLGYARDVLRDSLRARLLPSEDGGYALKEDEQSSHGRVLAWLADRPPARVLDIGCSGGHLAERMRKLGHHVVGVDRSEVPGVTDRVDRFVIGDLENGVPAEAGDAFDVVVAADVLEHVRHPETLLAAAAARLAPGGSVIVSVPNFGHWYPRARTAAGAFDYDPRGILDADHVRFFTRRSFERLVRSTGLRAVRFEAVGLPVDVLPIGRGLAAADRWLASKRPTLFAYQLMYELLPAPGTASPAAPAVP